VELIVRYGQHIDLAAIAETASGHPEVITSAAVGQPDGYRAEVPALYVVLRRKDPEIIADLEAHIRRKLPVPGAWPKWIVPLSALPLTAAGAIDHLALRRDAAARAANEAQLVSQFAAALSCRESAIWCSGASKGDAQKHLEQPVRPGLKLGSDAR